MYSTVKKVKRLCLDGNEIMRISVSLPKDEEHPTLCEFCRELAENALRWCEESEYQRLAQRVREKRFSRCDYELIIKTDEKGDNGALIYIKASCRNRGEKGGTHYEKRLFWSYPHNALAPEPKNMPHTNKVDGAARF